jgi:hypothetical protein
MEEIAYHREIDDMETQLVPARKTDAGPKGRTLTLRGFWLLSRGVVAKALKGIAMTKLRLAI